MTETLFGSLKVERLQFYNHRRLHSTLGYLSPMNFKKARADERKRLGGEERKAA